MPPLNDDGEERSLREELAANFDAWEKSPDGLEQAKFDIPDDRKTSEHQTRSESEIAGAADGSRPGDKTGQHADSPDKSPAAGGKEQQGERPRDESGRFAPKAPADAAQKDQQQDGQQAAPQPHAQGANGMPAPETFSEAGRQAWSNLHPEIRSHLEQTQRQHQEQLVRLTEPLRPLHEMSQRRGLGWQQGLERLTRAQEYLDRDPAGALIWLAQAHNLDLDQLADHAAALRNGQQPAQAANPVHSLNQVVAPLAQRLQSVESTLSAQQQAEQTNRRNAVLREVNTFASKPENSHFSAVEAEVYALIPRYRQQYPDAPISEVLKVAYDAAVYANPDVRQKVLAEQRAKEEQQAREARQGRTRDARALEIVTSHRGNGAHVPPSSMNGAQTLRQEIEQQWDAYEAANH
jgi:hypothetical protein